MPAPVITSDFTHKNIHINISTYDTYIFSLAMNHFHIAVLLAVTPCCNVAGGYQSLGGTWWKQLHVP
jgi:hypothetical protein